MSNICNFTQTVVNVSSMTASEKFFSSPFVFIPRSKKKRYLKRRKKERGVQEADWRGYPSGIAFNNFRDFILTCGMSWQECCSRQNCSTDLRSREDREMMMMMTKRYAMFFVVVAVATMLSVADHWLLTALVLAVVVENLVFQRGMLLEAWLDTQYNMSVR